jgi:pimeloyl-ACP methyl ester carboxylesterase
MVLVHSMGSSSAEWFSAAPLLAKHHRVFAVDLPGFGRSPLAARSGYAEGNATVMDSIIKQLKLAPAIVVGNSIGGLVSSLTAARYPASVRALVLVNPPLPIMNRRLIKKWVAIYFGFYSLPFAGPFGVNRYMAKRGAEQVLLGSLPEITANPTLVDKTLLKEMLVSLEEQLKFRNPMLAYCRGARSVVSHSLQRQRELAMFRRINCPVLLIHGAKDPLVPLANAERIAGLMPGWQFKVLPEAGHMPQLEQPAEVVEVINHWASGLNI